MKNKKTNIFEIFEKKKNLEKKQKNFYFTLKSEIAFNFVFLIFK